MIHCQDCEFFDRAPGGEVILRCDPFSTIKEASCLAKWQLLKLETIVQANQATAAAHQRLAPMQERMMKYMERELDDVDEADKWKYGDDDDDEFDEDDR